MTKDELKIRTKRYGIEVIKFIYSLPKDSITFVLTNQLVRSVTSIGANYRAALRSRSGKEFIAKMGIILEESNESLYWLEIMPEIPQFNKVKNEIETLMKEASELTAIFSTTLKTLRAKQNLKS